MRKLSRAGLVAITALGVALVPVVDARAAARPEVTLENHCGYGRATSRPRDILFTCGYGYYGAQNLKWQYWGRTNAIGTGKVYENDCEPSCAESRTRYYAAQFVATRPRKGKFTKVVVIFNRKRPVDVVDLSRIT